MKEMANTMGVPSPGRTLLGHLATLHSLASQGELLCTQGLTFLVNQSKANDAFRSLLEGASGVQLPPKLVWRAEERQADKGRPDMEARARDARWVKVEAKLGARLDGTQLSSFARDLADPERQFVLLLVPDKRRQEVGQSAQTWPSAQLSECKWRLADGGGLVVVMTWEQVFERLLNAGRSPNGGDLHQLIGLYQALNDVYVAPFAPEDADDAARDPDRARVVERATRRESERLGHSVMPMSKEALAGDSGNGVGHFYDRRYVVKQAAGQAISLAVGVRPPFVGHISRVWARFSYGTPGFDTIRSRLTGPGGPFHRAHVISERHLWLSLDLPFSQHAEDTVASLVQQIGRIWNGGEI